MVMLLAKYFNRFLNGFLIGLAIITVIQQKSNISELLTGEKLSDKIGWSEPVQIPIEIGERAPYGADIAIGNEGLYMTFQVYTPGVYQPHDVWLITFINGTWQAPVLIREISFTADGSKVAVSDRNQDDIIHLVWWDKRSDQPYNAENLFSDDTISEIWYTYKNNGEWSEPLKLFEGNHFTPKLTDLISRYGNDSILFTFYAGQNDANNGIPSLFLAVMENDWWQIKGPIVTGGGGEASLVQMNSDSIIIAFNAPGFEWIKDNIDSDWRGIFLKKSNDRGNTWNEPLQISRNEWEHTVTASPKLIKDPSGYLHLFWRQDTTGDNQPDNLFYTRSKDGLNWTGINLLNNKPDEVVTIQYYDIVSTSDGNLHLIYQAFREDNRYIMVHTWWNGQNWSIPEILTDQTTIRNPLLAYDDTKNQLHLVYGIQDTKVHDQTGILEWLDDNMKWNTRYRTAHDHLSDWSWYHMVYNE